jgi:trehalose/maltose hydrolase-like predicted phosphorylase
MVTMNEGVPQRVGNHFEEIHRNGAIAFGDNYHRYTGDYSYILKRFRGLDSYRSFLAPKS